MSLRLYEEKLAKLQLFSYCLAFGMAPLWYVRPAFRHPVIQSFVVNIQYRIALHPIVFTHQLYLLGTFG